jgi:hypothetical protein
MVLLSIVLAIGLVAVGSITHAYMERCNDTLTAGPMEQILTKSLVTTTLIMLVACLLSWSLMLGVALAWTIGSLLGLPLEFPQMLI